MAQISATKCDLCSENDGSIFCYECKQAMCLTCRSFHDKIPSTRKHKVSDLNKVDRLVFQSELECSTHQELFNFFCDQCKCLICSSCLLAEHKGHKFSGTEEIFQGARQNSIHLVSKGKEKLEEIKGAIDNVKSGHREKIKQDSDKVELLIKSTAGALHGIIDIVKDIRVNEVRDYKQLENEQIDRTVRKLEKLKVGYENTTSTFDQLLTETHDTTFYQSYNTHKSTFDKLDDIPQYSKPDDIRTFDEEAFFVDILLKMTERFKSAKSAVDIVAKNDDEIKDLSQNKVQKRTIETLRKNLDDKNMLGINISEKKTDCDMCVICMNDFNNPKKLSCGHRFCSSCINQQFEYKPACPVCGYITGILIGDQPPGDMKIKRQTALEMFAPITIEFVFPAGLQSSTHPNPGEAYSALNETMKLNSTIQTNRRVLKLLRIAFDRKLLFTIDLTNTIVWNDIPHTSRIDNEGRLKTKLYDKNDDFSFPIVSFPFLSSNIPAAPANGVYISQLIRYSRACMSYHDFLDRWVAAHKEAIKPGVPNDEVEIIPS